MENSSLELQLHDQFAAAAVQNVKMCKTCQMGDACRGKMWEDMREIILEVHTYQHNVKLCSVKD